MKINNMKDKLPLYICSSNYNVSTKKSAIDHIIREYETIDFQNKESNFPLTDTPDCDLLHLYEDFVNQSQRLFGPFTILPENSTQCWGVVTDNSSADFKSIHSHKKTSTINSVYYANIPMTSSYEDGSISFYWPDADITNPHEVFCYKPRNNDLIIIPNYLKHDRNHCSSSEYRIAINMEIKCDKSWPQSIFK